ADDEEPGTARSARQRGRRTGGGQTGGAAAHDPSEAAGRQGWSGDRGDARRSRFRFPAGRAGGPGLRGRARALVSNPSAVQLWTGPSAAWTASSSLAEQPAIATGGTVSVTILWAMARIASAAAPDPSITTGSPRSPPAATDGSMGTWPSSSAPT